MRRDYCLMYFGKLHVSFLLLCLAWGRQTGHRAHSPLDDGLFDLIMVVDTPVKSPVMNDASASFHNGYNKFDDATVRIGSWREELALKELTGVTRLANPKNKKVFNETGVRVLYHTDRTPAADAGKSTSEVSFVRPQSVAATKHRAVYHQPGPKAVRAKREHLAILEAEEAERLAAEADQKRTGDFDTTTRQSFVRYSHDDAKAARPDRVNKKGSSSSPPKDIGGGQEHAQIEEYDYSKGETITLWNKGKLAPHLALDDGSFRRNSRFTEPVYRPWLPDAVPGPIDSALDPNIREKEAEALTFLKRRVLERGAGNALPSVRGLWNMLRRRTYVDAPGALGHYEFREGMAIFEVPLTECELYAVVTAFDSRLSGQICLQKFMDFIRSGGLPESRLESVQDAFKRLDSVSGGTGSVSVDGIRKSCDFCNLEPSATSYGGRIIIEGREAKALEELVHHFDAHDERQEEDISVGIDDFIEAFRDVGAALTPRSLPGSDPRDDGDNDGVNTRGSGDDLFRAIISHIAPDVQAN